MATAQERMEVVLDRWTRDVFLPYCERSDARFEAVLKRLDRLNGWRNKLIGGAAVLGFGTPVIVGVLVALLIQGG